MSGKLHNNDREKWRSDKSRIRTERNGGVIKDRIRTERNEGVIKDRIRKERKGGVKKAE